MTKKKTVKKDEITKLLGDLWKISNEFEELSYRFDEVSNLLADVNFDFDSEKSTCFFYLSERLLKENKSKFVELQERLNKEIFNARGLGK
jgi:hypothetical protein